MGIAKKKAQRISCVGRLKNIALSFRVFATDHTNLFPMQLSTNYGGSREYIGAGDVFRHFKALSNELTTPLILICPADNRSPAKDFVTDFTNNQKVSYFLGLDADENQPQMLLAGDRNITNGLIARKGILELRTNRPAGWTQTMHRGAGNVALADGSVQQLNALRLQEQLCKTGDRTNRIAIPE
jgi:prepilin-type processing-associated H-X9-DG protein